MGTAYVYAPYSAYAKIWAGHVACSGGSLLTDISKYGSAGTSIKLYVNYPTVKSIQFIRVDNCCSCNDNTRHAGIVELYREANKTCYIGSILYGHLANPAASYWQNLTGGYVGVLGSIVSTPGSCSCYTGEHVHLEVWGPAQGTVTRLVTNNQSVSQGTTPIYKWDFTGCPT